MTDYSNPPIPEDINVGPQKPLQDFVLMLVTVVGVLLAAIVLLAGLAGWLLQWVSVDSERALADKLWPGFSAQFSLAKQDSPQREYLQQLTEQLAKAQGVAFPLTVHWSDSDDINAFATLGGHIVINRGLLNALPDENALAMVLAHEVAHIGQRDPLMASGRALVVSLALLSVSGFSEHSVALDLLGQVSLLTQLSYSREAESRADAAALQTLQTFYGHTRSADSLFRKLAESSGNFSAPQFLSSHPVNASRLHAIAVFAEQHPVPAGAQTTSLPQWLKPAAMQ